MQKFLSLMRVLLLLALTFLTYWGLVVVLYQDFQFQLTLGNDSETGQQLFYIIPWLMIMLVMLLPTIGTLAAMRKWILGKTWRKALVALVLLTQFGLVVLISQQRATLGEISFKPWKQADSVQAVQANSQADVSAEVTSAVAIAPKEAAEVLTKESPGAEPALVANEEEQLLADDGPWYGKYLNKCTALLAKYTFYFEKVTAMDNEMERLKAVLVERLSSGQMQKDWVLDVTDRSDARIDVNNEVMVPRYRHYQKERDNIEAIGNEPPGYQIPWLAKLEEEIDSDSARLEEESAKVEAITAELRQMIDN